MGIWVKNVFRGGDVFGSHCLGDGSGEGGRGNFFKTLKQKLPFLDLNQNRIDQLHDSIE